MAEKQGYEPLPSQPQDEKVLHRQQSSTELNRSKRVERKVILSIASIVTGLVLIATGMAVHRGLIMGCPGRADQRLVKRQDVRFDFVAASSSSSASASTSQVTQYSTSTFSNGDTSTYVLTTRPIVNPGGYTIGTMTGYVPVTSTTPLPAASSSSTVSPLPTESAVPPPRSSPSSDSTPTPTPVANVARSNEAVANGGEALVDRANEHVAVDDLTERSFAQVDAHILHKNGLQFEDPEAIER